METAFKGAQQSAYLHSLSPNLVKDIYQVFGDEFLRFTIANDIINL